VSLEVTVSKYPAENQQISIPNAARSEMTSGRAGAEGDPRSGLPSGGPRPFSINAHIGAELLQPYEIQYFTAGILLSVPPSGKIAQNAKALRGEIKEWSSSSRRRMREYLVSHEAPKGWKTEGLTLTVPGPVLTAVLCSGTLRR